MYRYLLTWSAFPGGFLKVVYVVFFVFFFQAEDGIRDIGVTGVQTCALPILAPFVMRHGRHGGHGNSSYFSVPSVVSPFGSVWHLAAGRTKTPVTGEAGGQ